MRSYCYLFIDIGCILIPFIASFYPKHAFYKEWKYFFPANLLVAISFLIWDYFFTKWGVWGFNPDYLTGSYIFNLPIEEVLFFICIPFACVFSYFALKYLVKKNPFSTFQKPFTIILMLALLLIALFNLDKWYTGVAFLSTAAYLMFNLFKNKNFSYHYLAYFLILPFFFMSNGLLTGSFLESPIVWYNDNENLGMRLFTIPIEDMVYGFLLIMMNIDLYEFLKRSHG